MIPKNNLRIAILIIMAALLSFAFGCSKKDIGGVTKDPFGKGISGVSVHILKTQFKSTTDGNGRYSLDYVPGTFTIQYSKDAYTTIRLDLAIQQKSKFPAEPIVMYPIPKEKGIHYIGGSKLIQLQLEPVIQTEERRSGYFPVTRYRYYMANKLTDGSELQAKDVLSIKPGKATFIDTFPQLIKLVKLANGNIIQDYSSGFAGSRNYHYNGLQDDKGHHVGEEKLLLRNVELTPGNYAWCGMVEMILGGIRPDKSLPCFPFIVLQSSTEKK